MQPCFNIIISTVVVITIIKIIKIELKLMYYWNIYTGCPTS